VKPYLIRQLSLAPVELPFRADALEPILSAESVVAHHRQHVRYCERARELAFAQGWGDTERLEDLVRWTYRSCGRSVLFEQAAQAWNHAFLWLSFDPRRSALESVRAEGLRDRFRDEIVEAAASSFGSGWVWLVQTGERVSVEITENAGTPIAEDPSAVPLLVVDVWEHAYFLDYGFDRKQYARKVVGLLDWEFAAIRSAGYDEE
jgi:Fe-Mn family superoxide dismutase